jgi:hypothetical protein
MTGLLDGVLAAQGAPDRWREFSTIEATIISGGQLLHFGWQGRAARCRCGGRRGARQETCRRRFLSNLCLACRDRLGLRCLSWCLGCRRGFLKL